MKRTFLVLLAFLLLAAPVFAFTSALKTLDKKEIAKLTDEQLTDDYLDAVVELEASRAFHATSGFSVKEYDAYKDLIKYRLLLLMEIHSRNLEMPQFER